MPDDYTRWDERDQELWEAIQSLPSYGLIGHSDRMISRKEILELMNKQARDRKL